MSKLISKMKSDSYFSCKKKCLLISTVLFLFDDSAETKKMKLWYRSVWSSL